MAYAEYATQLSLDRFFEIVGLHPLHASQLKTPSSFATDRAVGCSAVIYQHRYQSDNGTPGRNDIAREIFQAERDIEQLVHFPLTKRWITDEPIPILHHRRPFQLRWGYLIGPGIRTTAVIEEAVSVGTDDEDGDSFEETAVISLTLDQATYDALGGTEELRVFYPDKGPDPAWEIRPIRTSIDPDTLSVEIRCNLCQLVDPKLYEYMVPGVLDPEDPAVYLDTVDVYRVYTDTAIENSYKVYCQGQTSLVSTEGMVATIRSVEGSILTLSSPWRWPDVCTCIVDPTARFSYVAGFPGSTYTRMAAPLENAVAWLAMSRLGGICACTIVPGFGRDLSIISTTSSVQGNIEQTRWANPPKRVMLNPFGTSEGARLAYDIIVTEILGETGNSYL